MGWRVQVKPLFRFIWRYQNYSITPTVRSTILPLYDRQYQPEISAFFRGNEDEKLSVYEEPYRAICNELFRRGDSYDILKEKELIKFMCTSFVRGCTMDNTIVIVDEVNNMSFHELDSLITRIGENSKLIFCGDFRQSDLTKQQERQGLLDFMKIIDRLSGFEHIEFNSNDIVRSVLVKEYIIAREELGLCA